MTNLFDFSAWTAVGFAGQAVFGSRFIVQWIASERRKQSYVPVVFWYLSLLGGIILTIYAIGINDPVFTFGQGLGVFIYVRNLALIKNHRHATAEGKDVGTTSDRQRG